MTITRRGFIGMIAGLAGAAVIARDALAEPNLPNSENIEIEWFRAWQLRDDPSKNLCKCKLRYDGGPYCMREFPIEKDGTVWLSQQLGVAIPHMAIHGN